MMENTLGNEPKKTPGQVADQVTCYSAMNDKLEDFIKRLGLRLSDVLKELPSGEGLTDGVDPAVVPLAEALRHNNHRLTFSVNAIESIIERLEL